MTKEEVIAYLKENPLPDDVSPATFIYELLIEEKILFSDYLELQRLFWTNENLIIELPKLVERPQPQEAYLLA